MATQVTIKFTEASVPAGKLADAELHFNEGLLAGLKLIGFAVWQRRDGKRTVTFPARNYSIINGERRSFALLRPITGAHAQDAVRDAILQAYAVHVGELTIDPVIFDGEMEAKP